MTDVTYISQFFMRINIHHRVLLVIFPILFYTLLPTASGVVLSFLNSYISNKETFTAILFTLALAYVVPTSNSKWMLFGSGVAFYTIYKFIIWLQPEYHNAYLAASFLAPLTTAILLPRYHAENSRIKAIIINYGIAIFFLILISLTVGFLSSLVFEHLQTLINQAYFQHVYNDDFSFVYGIIYQFTETFGFGQFILDIRKIAEDSLITQNFYATTMAINMFGIPSIFLAIIHTQKINRKIFFFIMFLLSIISAPNHICVSFILIFLMWYQPSLYGIFLITGIFFYIFGQYINFDLHLKYNDLYNLKKILSTLTPEKISYLLFCIFIVVTNFFVSVITILKARTYVSSVRQLPKVNPVIINLDIEEESQDFSLTSISIIKYIGGFNNITHMKLRENTIVFTIENQNLAKQFTACSSINNVSKCELTDENHITIIFTDHPQQIYETINSFAKRLFIDLKTEYTEVKPFILKID